MTSGPASVRVACAQLALDVDRPHDNLRATVDAIVSAANDGAQVVVLPELASSGYVFADAEELGAVAESRSGASVTAWSEAAAAHGVVVVGGFPERASDGLLYNTAVLVEPSGPRAFYRKAHLWDRERGLFVAGDEPPPVVSTAVGRIGLMVCYDLEFPEWVRLAALGGAELICAPANWPWFPRPDGERPVEVVKVQANASVNRVAVAVCDRVGAERGVSWLGGSVIVDADGYPQTALSLGEPASLMADVDLAATRRKRLGPSNDVFDDRRTELYGPAAPTVPASGGAVQHETDRVRVTRWTLPTGASTGRHVHQHDYVVVPLTAGRMTVVDDAGQGTQHELTPGVSYVRTAGATHDVRNLDPGLVDFVEVELLEGGSPEGG
jgi:predicted amidohydrolase/quercetin dioxygenase-like cupin family protein